ncbi:hypothetical protein D1816_17705 [Aquimarina sp. AD10]|uniref:hypothetical protein n=1 Tax=Aquimarina sp. AD10 TaxID=1714849 RepID=UPI000E4A3166|nr:hypothetical protein [Aquimarina sp. AD10]AXT62116.1 hypothetical protein D1816_17705 [Aquimarina sp. AD10]RKM99896.1 hypothetical protein D7033_09875 [Aquimarina sp. AD10]
MKTFFIKPHFLILLVLTLSCYAQKHQGKSKGQLSNGISIDHIRKPVIPDSKLIKPKLPMNPEELRRVNKISFSSINDKEFLFISGSSNSNSQASSKNRRASKNNIKDKIENPSQLSDICIIKPSREGCFINLCTKEEICDIVRSEIGSVEPPRGCSTGHCNDKWNRINRLKYVIRPFNEFYKEIVILDQKGNKVGGSINEKHYIEGVSGYVAYPISFQNKIYGVAQIKIRNISGTLRNKSFYVRPQ